MDGGKPRSSSPALSTRALAFVAVKTAVDGLRVFGGRPVMTDSVVVRGSTDGEAKSFHLKHSLTVRVANHRIAHVPGPVRQHLVLWGGLHVDMIRERNEGI